MTHPQIQRWKTLYTQTKNCLCIGIDPTLQSIPTGYSETISGLTEFLSDFIQISQEHCIAFKPNISFFEALGIEGLQCLETICKTVQQRVPIIMDAKRGDIGNTSAMQARYIFDYFNADAVTLHPYMGLDSLEPFFKYQDKFHFVLGLTSNPGSRDFEESELNSGKTLASHVIETLSHWNKQFHNIGVVVGATEQKLATVRAIDPSLLFLIPGVGAQGGTYHSAYEQGKNTNDLALVNASRAIMGAIQSKSSMENDIRNAIQALTKPL